MSPILSVSSLGHTVSLSSFLLVLSYLTRLSLCLGFSLSSFMWGSSSLPHLIFISHSAGPTFLVSPSLGVTFSLSPFLLAPPSLSHLLFVSLFADLTFSVSPSFWIPFCWPHLLCLTFSLCPFLLTLLSLSHLLSDSLSACPTFLVSPSLCISFCRPHFLRLTFSLSPFLSRLLCITVLSPYFQLSLSLVLCVSLPLVSAPPSWGIGRFMHIWPCWSGFLFWERSSFPWP